MAPGPVRILLLGADASMWVGLSSKIGPRPSQIVVPKEIDLGSISAAATGVDVVVLVLGAGPDRLYPLHLIGQAGLEKRTIVLAPSADQRVASDAVLLGVAGFLEYGCSPERLAMVIEQVIEEGVVYDASGAAELHSRMGITGGGNGAANLAAAKALASALELKDTYTGGHAERVSWMALRLARVAMVEEALPSEALEAAFLLHDVGKIGIPESILNKAATLTATERRVLETHPVLGQKIVAPLRFPEVVGHVIRHHHERWDGTGYPDHLAGTEIPPAARLFSIADVLDAMTSIRPYRKPVSLRRAIDEIKAQAGSQFDPDLCELVDTAFLSADDEVSVPFS